MAHTPHASTKKRQRLGEWLPPEEHALANFRRELLQKAKHESAKTEPAGVVSDFASFIRRDAVVRMNLSRAIGEARERGYELGYTNIDELVLVLNHLLSYAPPFDDSSAIILPMNAIFEWPMCMPSGHAVFRDPAFNTHLKRLLNTWCAFLSGPYSRTHLTEDAPHGWFCVAAIEKVGMEQFICAPDQPHWGFESWNQFFTRRLRPGSRPVAEPQSSKIIVNACEAAPYAMQHDVKLQDEFWIKAQPYSLLEMFGGGRRALAQRYVGGSVYQAYLGAHNYHRWHAPVEGTVVDQYLVDGTYYSDIEAEGDDPKGLNDSQGYTTSVAARSVIVIECDDKSLGQVACLFIGMAEVSSCVIETFVGQHVRKGDELGFFQYGGSTYCLVFEAGVVQDFTPKQPFDDSAPPLKVNMHLATAR
jgi:phosphatidylserine decarboxylase